MLAYALLSIQTKSSVENEAKEICDNSKCLPSNYVRETTYPAHCFVLWTNKTHGESILVSVRHNVLGGALQQ